MYEVSALEHMLTDEKGNDINKMQMQRNFVECQVINYKKRVLVSLRRGWKKFRGEAYD